MNVSRHIPNDIKHVSRSIGFALWIGDTEQWFGLSEVFRARLTPQERASLAFQTLKSLDHDDASIAAKLALYGAASGAPIAPLFDPVDEAAHWAARSDLEELDTYLVAIFDAIPPSRQRAFLDYAGRAAA